MDVVYHFKNDEKQLDDFFQKIQAAEPKSAIVFIGEKSPFSIEQIQKKLDQCKFQVNGGIFPGVFSKEGYSESGMSALTLNVELNTKVVTNLNAEEEKIYSDIEEWDFDIEEFRSMFVLVDALSSNIGTIINSLFSTFASEMNYFGGGCGSITFKPQKCVIAQNKIYQNAAVLSAMKSNLSIGVEHGFSTIAGPFRVSRSTHNQIEMLDSESAFSVYKKTVSAHSGKEISAENFFELAKSYPFGIARFNSEMVVRDPFEVGADGSISCFGDVPENTSVHILNGNPVGMVRAAINAKNRANAGALNAAQNPLIVMDCISRVLFLGEGFSKEFTALNSDGTPIFGAACLGEVANSGDEPLEYYNKSCVVAKIAA